MSLTEETIHDLVLKKRFMNRQDKAAANRGNKPRAIVALHSRKATAQKMSLFHKAGNAPEPRQKQMRKKARRAGHSKTIKGQSMEGQIKLTKLRKNRDAVRRQWSVIQNVENVEPTLPVERVQWKGKTKLAGRGKHAEFDQFQSH